MQKFYEGQSVTYVPNHANGDIAHKDCEHGVVSSVQDQPDGTQKVWVRYSAFGGTGQLTPTKNLVA